jgi:redox-sensing transcriptional repressor
MTINKNCILRLSKYKNSLSRLKSFGFVKVFSDNLADAAGVTASQVRKDFSLFGITGNKKGGYIIDELIDKLNNILGKNQIQKVVVVGAGHIGAALTGFKGFEKEGIKIVACFDIDPAKFNKYSEIPVLPFEDMKPFIKDNGIKIAVLAVPDTSAQQVWDTLKASGIKGVLNFAPVRLRDADDYAVNNVNLELELENVIYFVNAMIKTKAKQ